MRSTFVFTTIIQFQNIFYSILLLNSIPFTSCTFVPIQRHYESGRSSSRSSSRSTTSKMYIHTLSSPLSSPSSMIQHRRRCCKNQSRNTPLQSSSSSLCTSTTLAALPSSIVDNINIPTILIQTITGITTYIALIAYYDRPRGNIQIDTSIFQVKPSQVPNGGLGLYITKSAPEGTILGTYPGVLRPANKFITKYESKPQTATYTWRFTDSEYCIDPTNIDGLLVDECYGGTNDYPLSYFIHERLLRFISVPTLLARINEPPIGGGGCNVRSEENLERREVIFELSRDVLAGEELFMDYGLTYDRSSYGPDT